MSEEAVRGAKRKYGGEGCRFMQMDDRKPLPFPDASFPLIVSFQVIEHVADVQGYLGEIRRLLKHGGKALITTPNRLLRMYKYQRPINPFHLREYSPKELERVVRQVFPSHDPYGLFGSPSIMEVEITRLAKYRSPAAFTKQIVKRVLQLPLKISGFSPLKLKARISSSKGSQPQDDKTQAASIDRESWKQYKPEHYFLKSGLQNGCLDLFFILNKE